MSYKRIPVPVGTILAWSGGYFGNGSNGSFTSVLGNTVAAANTVLNNSGYYVCDGSALNLSTSPIFNGAGRFLPNLTDSRFLQGSTVAGSVGGQNSTTISSSNLPTHTHAIDHTHANHVHSINHDHAQFASISSGDHNHNATMDTTGGFDGGRLQGSNRVSNATYIVPSTNSAHIHAIDIPAFSGESGNNTTAVSFTGLSGNGGFANTAIENRPLYISVIYVMRVN